MPLRRMPAVLASVAAALLWAIPSAVAQETSTSTSSTSTSTTSTTTPAPTSTTAPTPAPPPLPPCQEVLASDPGGSVGGDDPTRISLADPPRGRRLAVDLHYTGGANTADVRTCVSFTASGRALEVATKDDLGQCCISFDRRFTVALPRQPAPGSQVCAQAAIRETFANGGDTQFGRLFTNRACVVVPGGSQGQLPFTGSARALPVAFLGAAAVALGAVALLTARALPQRHPR